MRDIIDQSERELGVSNLIEYLIITSVLLILMVIMTLSINPVFIEGPVNQLSYNAYTDVGNGISTRIVDLYVIAPYEGNILTKFDIPDDVVGKGYFVNIETGGGGNDMLIVSGNNNIQSKTSLAGIGDEILRGAEGSTSSSGINEISYNSAGG